jgi:hypothetical protein
MNTRSNDEGFTSNAPVNISCSRTSSPQGRTNDVRTRLLICAMALIGASTQATHASDRVAVYAKVDRVVLAPNAEEPDTIQVWGVFSLAQTNNPNDYRPAARGYLYFSPGNEPNVARREWADLKNVAGTGQLIAFGTRYESIPRLRQPNEKPADPDAYAVNTGVTKVQGRTDYAPIRALLDYRP